MSYGESDKITVKGLSKDRNSVKIEEMVRKIIELILVKEKNFSLEKFNDNLAKMVSCKMSIKANTYVDKPSMESLINDLRKCDNPYNCPHGRPSIIHFSKYELEKMFKEDLNAMYKMYGIEEEDGI